MTTLRFGTGQPQGIAQIDWSSPVTKDLSVAMLATLNTGFDAVSGKRGSYHYNSSANSIGAAGQFFTQSTSYEDISVEVNCPNDRAGASIIYVGSLTQPTAFQIFNEYTLGGAYESNMSVSTSNILSFNFWGGYSSNYTQITSSVALTRGLHVVSWSINNNLCELCIDGVIVGSSSGVGVFRINPIKVGPRGYGSNNFVTGSTLQVLGVLAWARPVSKTEFSKLASNPWQIFQKPSRKIWVGIESSLGSASLTATESAVDTASAIVTAISLGSASLTATESAVDTATSTVVAVIPLSASLAITETGVDTATSTVVAVITPASASASITESSDTAFAIARGPINVLYLNRNSGLITQASSSDVINSAFFTLKPIMLSYGTATLDFDIGLSETYIEIPTAIINQPNSIKLWIAADDTTLTHTANDHKYAPLFIGLTSSIASPGLRITGTSKHKLTGQFKIRYSFA